ncbi:hypothetical protein MPNT_330005 [Candidatus Methylacidithermus pantelleriae]|uniref:Uncharacterized protein n=1 Tax=Candidatus Methylacidithermus pantelleriae TaxID=2744239 RepID=A0A8J2FRK2_9BACT|nr:hypothetical protein MPNT_330005 [Candidatus Methylacidithermus pantelleriae]
MSAFGPGNFVNSRSFCLVFPVLGRRVVDARRIFSFGLASQSMNQVPFASLGTVVSARKVDPPEGFWRRVSKTDRGTRSRRRQSSPFGW